MTTLQKIKKPISKEIQAFEKAFENSLSTESPILSSLNKYLLQGKGKQLRPILILLSAKLCGKIDDSTINSAIAIELLHTASIVHDDVVDYTLERRGRESINAIWNNKIAVLAGDYIVSSALRYAAKTKKIEILELLSNIGLGLSAGEILQLFHVKSTNVKEEDYYNIIVKKTAILFSLGMEIGALSANATAQECEHLRKYGENLGICFQLKDDIFDYFKSSEIGKPTGNDIREGKITLPLIYALKNTKGEEREEIASKINQADFSDENIAKIIEFAQKSGGIEYTLQQMELFKNKALKELEIFPNSEAKEALINCAEYTLNRNK